MKFLVYCLSEPNRHKKMLILLIFIAGHIGRNRTIFQKYLIASVISVFNHRDSGKINDVRIMYPGKLLRQKVFQFG